MSSSTSRDVPAAPKVAVVADLFLPSDDLQRTYQLFCWTVHNGSSVRIGETVALAIPVADDIAVSTTIESPDVETTSSNPAAAGNEKIAPGNEPPLPARGLTSERQPHQSDQALGTRWEPSSVAASATQDTSVADLASRKEEMPTVHALVTTRDPHATLRENAEHKRPTKRKRPTKVAPASKADAVAETIMSPSTHTSALSNSRYLRNVGNGSSDDGTIQRQAPTLTGSMEMLRPLRDRKVAIIAPANGILRIVREYSTGGVESQGRSDASNGMIGFIEECHHPTILYGLCAVCGQPVKGSFSGDNTSDSDRASLPLGESNDSSDDRLSHAISSRSSLTMSGLTVSVSESEAKLMAEQDAVRLQRLRKLALVLDLDHTLVHATGDPRARHHLYREDVRSLLLPLLEEGQQALPMAELIRLQQLHQPLQNKLEGKIPFRPQVFLMQHFVKLRPNIKEFLVACLPLYEISVYTAGTRNYAEQIALILARFLVGAVCDQPDIDRLRHRLSQARAEVARAEQLEASRLSEPTETDTHQRKRVTFGQVPSSVKTDRTTAEDVTQLQHDLAEAERLENAALEMRQRLFGSRVVSRTDVGDLGRDVKSLTRIFACGGSMAAVVDDREDVWANAADVRASRRGEPPDNLLLVQPYHWPPFLGFADINNAAGVDLSGGSSTTEDADEPESDQQLLWTADILKRLHLRYYSELESSSQRLTVPYILGKLRSEVLDKTRLVLSGLIPLHKQEFSPQEPRPPVVRYAECLGAALLSNVDKTTTHVVAAKDGTDKTLAARKVSSCVVVKVSWLMECWWSLTRRDEQQHLLCSSSSGGVSNNHSKRESSPPQLHSTEIKQGIQSPRTRDGDRQALDQDIGEPWAVKVNSEGDDGDEAEEEEEDDDDDDDDDDLAAELENELLSEPL